MLKKNISKIHCEVHSIKPLSVIRDILYATDYSIWASGKLSDNGTAFLDPDNAGVVCDISSLFKTFSQKTYTNTNKLKR